MLQSLLVAAVVKVPWVGPRVLFRMHRRGRGFATVGWAQFARQVLEEKPDGISVDVFDTCLVRDLAGDDAVERAIEHRRLHSSGGVGSGPPDLASELEREVCRPVVGAVEGLQAIRAVVPNVTFISDTERSSAFLLGLLESHGLTGDGDRLFASCEEGTTKANGDLFDRVWSQHPGSGAIWHVGNGVWADGVKAAQAGLRPFHVPDGDLNRYEELFIGDGHGVGPAIAGAARLARLEIRAEADRGLLTEGRAKAQTLGASLAGQALVAFNLWLAERVQEHQLTNLGFLARDGELPMRIAQTLPSDTWGGTSMVYLHCSRMIWGLASASAVGLARWLEAGTADGHAFLETHRHDIPLLALLDRIGLNAADFAKLGSSHAALTSLPLDQPLPAAAVDAWHDLLADDGVGELILERSEARRKLLTDYLLNEGLLDGKVGLVDVGWRGRLAWHISSVFRASGAAEPIHLHFAGNKVIPEVDNDIVIKRFAYQGDDDAEVAGHSPVARVETLTASGKPRVVDYRRTGGGDIELVFESSAADRGDRSDLWDGALRVAANMPSRKTLDSWGASWIDLAGDVRRLLELWWHDPDPDEVRAIADLAFEHDEAGTAMRPLAVAYTRRELLQASGEPRAWPAGSEALSPIPTRILVRLGRRLRNRFTGHPDSPQS